MNISEQVLRLLSNNAPKRFDVPAIAEALGITDGQRQPIYSALHELYKGLEIHKAKKSEGGGSWYWFGNDLDPGDPAAPAPDRSTQTAPAPRKKRKYSRRQSAPVEKEQVTGEHDALFAVRSDGELAISRKRGDELAAISLSRQDVKRLSDFLEMTSTLWG